MMSNVTENVIAILLEKTYQDLEVWYPHYRLQEAGVETVFVAPDKDKRTGKYGYPIQPDITIADVNPVDFDGIIIPGGFAPDYMRRDERMVDFVRNMYAAEKLVAAICHGGWMLASADIIDGKDVTSFYGIKDDMVNAGGIFIDQEVVQDDNIITARKPDDLPAFMQAILSSLKKR
jgi:protease I